MRLIIFMIFVALSPRSFAASSAISLLGENLHPEGIAYRESAKTFYVGSASDGSIQTVTKDGRPKIIQRSGLDGRKKALGMKIDEIRNRLWLVDNECVYIYTLDSNKLVKKLSASAISKAKNLALNDLVLDEGGSAYITDSFNPQILRVDGKSLAIELWAQLRGIPYGQQNDFPYNLNGIVFAPDQKSLIAVKTNDGTLWRIDVATKNVVQIPLAEPVTKGDGLVNGESGELFVIRNFENKISKVDLNESGTTKRKVATVESKGLKTPTTAVYLREEKELVVVNSQFGENQPTIPYFLSVLHVGGSAN